jgi:hypothetical protein
MADRPFGFRTHPSVTSSASPEAVFDVIADLRNHLIWSGERAESDGFKMLTLEAPPGPATVGTTFTSSGSAGKDMFHDRSVVTEVSGLGRSSSKRTRAWNAGTRRRGRLTSRIATTCTRRIPDRGSYTPRPSNA